MISVSTITYEKGDVRHFAQVDMILDLWGSRSVVFLYRGFDSLYGAARQINDFMIAEGIGGQQRDGSQLLDGSLLGAL